jgi:hypothetical protein
MSVNFRSRYKKKKSSLHKRHSKGAVNEGGRYPSILLKDKIPPGVDLWSCKEGDHYVDIIPFYAGKDMPPERMRRKDYRSGKHPGIW